MVYAKSLSWQFIAHPLPSENYVCRFRSGVELLITLLSLPALEATGLLGDLDDELPAHVLVRLYQLPSENDDLVRRITFATNSQNPVNLRDLKANDDKQQRLEIDVQQLGYVEI